MNKYETPVLEFYDFQSEGMICWSAIEKLEESEGDWGW